MSYTTSINNNVKQIKNHVEKMGFATFREKREAFRSLSELVAEVENTGVKLSYEGLIGAEAARNAEEVCELIRNKYDFSHLLGDIDIGLLEAQNMYLSFLDEEKRVEEETKEKIKLEMFKDTTYIVKGLTQMGKTGLVIDFAIYCYLRLGKVLIILRNFAEDLHQFEERLKARIAEYYTELNVNQKGLVIKYVSNSQKKTKKINSNGIHIVLGNATALKPYLAWKEKSYACFIDEADFLDSGASERTRSIESIKAKSHGCFLVSATVLDCLGKNNVLPKNLILVPRLPIYKSIEYFQTQYSIPEGAKFTSDIDEDLFVNDPSFMPFLTDHFSKLLMIQFRGEFAYKGREFTMPNICLVSVTDKKRPMYKAQKLLQRVLPCLETAVYTADGICVSRDGRNPVMLKNTTFAAYLQSIKDDFIRGLRSLNNILVFAGDLAERGVSFVSSDYEWHLNYMRILAPENRIVPECIQEVGRLTGNFNDNISLYLCCTEKFKKKVYAGNAVQEEMMLNLKKSVEEEKKEFSERAESRTCKTVLESQPIFKDKLQPNLTRNRNILKLKKTAVNTGFSTDIYSGMALFPADYYKMLRITPPTPEERKEYQNMKFVNEDQRKDWERHLKAIIVSNGEENVEEKVEEKKEEKVEENKEGEEKDCIRIFENKLSKQERETYNLVLVYFRDHESNVWVKRAAINQWMQELGTVYEIATRLNHLQDKGIPATNSCKGLLFKKEGSRWKLKLNI